MFRNEHDYAQAAVAVGRVLRDFNHTVTWPTPALWKTMTASYREFLQLAHVKTRPAGLAIKQSAG